MGDWRDVLREAGEFDIEPLLDRIAAIEAQVADLNQDRNVLSDERLAQRARAVHRARIRREIEFGEGLFGEPAWDILLDLFVNRVRGTSVRTDSLCIAAGVPSTTALRWIGLLEERDLLRRFPSTDDRRVTLIEMTAKGHKLMRRALVRFAMPKRG